LKRLMPRIGVIYKGSGYYSTDYGNGKAKTGRTVNEDGPLQNSASRAPAAAAKADESEY